MKLKLPLILCGMILLCSCNKNESYLTKVNDMSFEETYSTINGDEINVYFSRANYNYNATLREWDEEKANYYIKESFVFSIDETVIVSSGNNDRYYTIKINRSKEAIRKTGVEKRLYIII